MGLLPPLLAGRLTMTVHSVMQLLAEEITPLAPQGSHLYMVAAVVAALLMALLGLAARLCMRQVAVAQVAQSIPPTRAQMAAMAVQAMLLQRVAVALAEQGQRA